MSKRKKPRYEASPVTPVQSEAEESAAPPLCMTVRSAPIPPPPPLLSLKVKSQMAAPPLCMKVKSQMAATPPPAPLKTLVSKIMV